MPDAAVAERRTLAPLGRRSARVLANELLGAYRLIRVGDRQGPYPCAGQFYMLAMARGWGAGEDERPYLPRAFSFARARPPAPQGGSESDGLGAPSTAGAPRRGGPDLEFLLEAIGPGTEALAAAAPGDEMLLTGPLGVGFRPPPDPGLGVLVAGGIGAAPILAWRDELGSGPAVLLGFRSAVHAEAARLFESDAVLATDDGSVGRRALVTELLREELDRAGGEPRTVYACGPPPMLEAVRAICSERGTEAQLALEAGMACGYGACFGCVVPTRSGYIRLCVDGPVVRAADLETAVVRGAGH